MTDENNVSKMNDDALNTEATSNDNTSKDESAQIRELRSEAKARRLQAKEAEKKAQEAEAKAQQALQRIDELQKTSNDRVIRAELKAQAIANGMIDLDGLKLADLSAVTIDDNGDVQGAAELIKALKENKPYLFKEVTNTSTNSALPQPGATQGKKAADMAPDEWKKDIAKYGIR